MELMDPKQQITRPARETKRRASYRLSDVVIKNQGNVWDYYKLTKKLGKGLHG